MWTRSWLFICHDVMRRDLAETLDFKDLIQVTIIRNHIVYYRLKGFNSSYHGSETPEGTFKSPRTAVVGEIAIATHESILPDYQHPCSDTATPSAQQP